MADITRDSFDETKRYQKVVFQRGRDVPDFELNELQDLIRVAKAHESSEKSEDGFALYTALRPSGTGASNDITIAAGSIWIEGHRYNLSASSALSTLGVTLSTNGGANLYEYIYISVVEVEVTASGDPAIAVGALGETAVRRQLEVTWNVGASVPADTGLIAEGGTRYFPIARLFRATGVAAIGAEDVLDQREFHQPLRSEYVRAAKFKLTDTGTIRWTETGGVLAIQDPASTSDLTRGLGVKLPHTAPIIISGSWALTVGQALVIRPKFGQNPASGTIHMPGVAVGSATNGLDDPDIAVVDYSSIVFDPSIIVIAHYYETGNLILGSGRVMHGDLGNYVEAGYWNGPDILYPNDANQIAVVHPSQGLVDGSRTLNEWNLSIYVDGPEAAPVMLCDANGGRLILCLNDLTDIPDGAVIKQVLAIVKPGASRSAGNQMKLQWYRQTITDIAGVPTPTVDGNNDITEGAFNTNFQYITMTISSPFALRKSIIDNSPLTTQQHFILLEGGNDADANNDLCFQLLINFTRPPQ